MAELEFEQKYVLDPRQAADIAIRIPSQQRSIFVIRQFYEDGVRYRCTHDGFRYVCTREDKKGLKLDTPYSVSLEETPEHFSISNFNDGWATSKNRLNKVRYEFDGIMDQKVMVDFFLQNTKTYAVVAEVEVMLTEDTKVLYLDLELPIYLKDFLLKTIDARDPSSKIFKSKNMTESNIENIEKALEQLYEHKPL